MRELVDGFMSGLTERDHPTRSSAIVSGSRSLSSPQDLSQEPGMNRSTNRRASCS